MNENYHSTQKKPETYRQDYSVSGLKENGEMFFNWTFTVLESTEKFSALSKTERTALCLKNYLERL